MRTFIFLLLLGLYIRINAQTADATYSPDSALILTPAPAAAPRINGPKVFGVRPGHPIVFTIPATG
ncbi:MAG TPA: hypothetical protein VG605_09775, partial [Puia sp.]|nr:hypothetical protein [Puia sp.]